MCRIGYTHQSSQESVTMNHGRKRYDKGCRCEVCVAAAQKHRKANKDRKRALIVNGVLQGATHGIVSSYTYGCRCLDCTAAQARRIREFKERQKTWRAYGKGS